MRRLNAYHIYLALEGAYACFFALIATVNLVYQMEVAHLNPLQLVLVGTVLEGTAFLCEVPTGILADTYSRRLSVILGIVLTGAGFMLEGLVPRFGAILLAQVIWGVGATFASGAEEAWIAGEIGDERAGPAYLRAAQAGQLGTLLGIPLSVALASVRLNLPIVVGGALILALGLALVLVMPERGFRPAPRERHGAWRTFGATFLRGGRLVRRSPLLLSILGVAAFFGMSSEGFDRLWTAHILTDYHLPALGQLDPVVWFGVIRASTLLLSIAATDIVRRRLDTRDHRAVTRTLFITNTALIASIVVFGLAGNFALALGAVLVASALRRVDSPVYTAWLSQSIAPEVRATVLSMGSQMDAFGQIAGGPVVGVIGTFVSLRAAMVATAVALAPALPLFARAGRHGAATAPIVEEAGATAEP